MPTANCKLTKKLFHTYSVMHFAFLFSEYIVFSEYMTSTSSREALKVCEHNFLLNKKGVLRDPGTDVFLRILQNF